MLVAAVCVISSTAWGADPQAKPEIGWDRGRLETGRSAALSGADLAFGSSISALLSNPANMAASRIYHVGAFASLWPEAARQSYGAAVVDSSTSSTGVAGGLAAAWTVQDPEGINRRGSDLRLGIAFPFSRQFRIGASARYLSFRQNGTGPLGTSLASGGLAGEPILRGFGVDAGATLQPSPSLALSLVGFNLNAPGNSLQPMLAGGGVGYGTGVFTLEANAIADFSTWEKTSTLASGGGELLLADRYPLRAGYRYDTGTERHAASVGAGYIDRSMSLEVGLRRTVGHEASTTIVFSFTYHVESAGMATSSGDIY